MQVAAGSAFLFACGVVTIAATTHWIIGIVLIIMAVMAFYDTF